MAPQSGQNTNVNELSGVYRVGGPVSPPKPIYDPDPAYTDMARQAKYQGTVVLWLVITREGLPTDIRIQEPIGMGLDERAVDAVKQWRFEPAKKGGEPVPVMINVEVNFRLENAGEGLPLFGSRPPAGTPPQFSGVDMVKYPLVIHVASAIGTPAGKSFEIDAKVSLEGPESRSLLVSCSGTKKDCSHLSVGYYPARWLSGNQRLEILGRKSLGEGKWIKAEYAIATGQNSLPTPQSESPPPSGATGKAGEQQQAQASHGQNQQMAQPQPKFPMPSPGSSIKQAEVRDGVAAGSNLTVLSDTQGVDFGPYLSKVVDAVRRNWYTLIPEEARAPEMKRGELVIEFAIMPDGKVSGMRLASPSGDVLLDRAAWGGITASMPFVPLPSEFHGPYIALRFRFYYNPQKKAEEQGAQSATANQNSSYGGQSALPPAASEPKSQTLGNLEVLTDTQGVDFGPYLSKVVDAVRRNWYTLIPEEARAPLMKRGKLAIEFAILPDGTIKGMRLVEPSGDVSMDRAAWGGITTSMPFAPLPTEFHGPYLALRFHFYYNPQKGDLDDRSKTQAQ